MVQELKRERQQGDFPQTAPAANPVFFRTYSRRTANGRETWEQVCDRTTQGFAKLGKLTESETAQLYKMMSQLKSLASGRWLWVGGTECLEECRNFRFGQTVEPVWLFEGHQTGSFIIKTDLSQQVMTTTAKLANQSEPTDHMSIDNSQTSKDTPTEFKPTENLTNADPHTSPQKAPQPGRIYIFTIAAVLSAVVIGASLFALVIPSCDEGSLNVKLWAFEYQLTKRGSCNTLAK